MTLAAVYVGTVVGAGFASGQEVLQFFTLHGTKGLGALALATAVLALFGYLLMRAGWRLAATSYGPVIRHVAGPVVGRALDFALTFFLFAGTAAMFAGAGAALAQEYGLPYEAGLLGMAGATMLTVISGIRGVVSSVSFVVPFLLAAVGAVSAATLATGDVDLGFAQAHRAPVSHWALSGVVYGSFNLLLAASVLAPLARLTPRERLAPGVALGALGLGLGALAVNLTILVHVPEAASAEVPMVLAAARMSPALALAYTVVLMAEVYTTAVSGLFGFVNRVAGEDSRWYRVVTIAATGLAALAGRAGFARLVAVLFPLEGYVGLVLLGALALAFVRRRL